MSCIYYINEINCQLQKMRKIYALLRAVPARRLFKPLLGHADIGTYCIFRPTIVLYAFMFSIL